jgi:hypothetical protein
MSNKSQNPQSNIGAVMHSAFTWWDTLRNTRLCNGTKDKGYYTDKYFGFNMRMYKYLSKDEIVMIYSKEHCE